MQQNSTHPSLICTLSEYARTMVEEHGIAQLDADAIVNDIFSMVVSYLKDSN